MSIIAAINLKNMSDDQTEYAILKNMVLPTYGKVARDLAACMHQVYGFIKKHFNETRYGIKIKENSTLEMVEFESTDYKLAINISESEIPDTIEKASSLYSNRIYAEDILNEFDDFIINSDNENLKKSSSLLRVYVNSLLAGDIYGVMEITSDCFRIILNKYDLDCKPILATIEICN
jgi:hypothetical protein